MNAYQPIELAGTTLWLLAEKAVYWPEQQALLIADIHFGKAAAYRRLGQPVPHGTTDANLRQLDDLLARYACRQLIFLGDFLHAPESRAPSTLARLAEWRAEHAQLAITLVRGNHDRRAGDPPAELGIEVVSEPLLLGPYALQHEPQPHPATTCWPATFTPPSRYRGVGASGCACRASASANGSACCQPSAASPAR